MARISREEYRRRYGPTTGDVVRLGDTDLWLQVEDDHVGHGDEPLWGYAKNFRSRQLQYDRVTSDSELDMVVAGALVVDPLLGVVKTNIGIKDGRVVGVGRAGSPETVDDVDMAIGPNTCPVDAYGLVATAGVVDSHVHALTPQIVPAALSAGVTTLVTAGFEEPPYVMERTLEAFEHAPVNLGLQASARTDVAGHVERVARAGACGLKVHEDWGAYPEIVDATLTFADQLDLSVCLHTDGLNESGELADTVAAIAGRAVHAYHVEGSGGGHLPDVLALVREPSVVCSSTTPTVPYGAATLTEQLDMKLVVHGGSVDDPDDVAAVRELQLPARTAAEGPLHELGAISIVNSDSQGMGRIGETFTRTMQLAHVMKHWRGTDAGTRWPVPRARVKRAAAGGYDNARVLRYLAKITLEPAITHGIDGEVGTLAPGRLADIVLWRPTHFGVKPELVLKSGYLAWGALGDGNGSVELVEPRVYGAHWGGHGLAAASLSTTFVSSLAMETDIGGRLGSRRRYAATSGCRDVRRKDLAANGVTAAIEVDPVDGTVTLDGHVLACEPVTTVPLSRRFVLG